MTGINREAKQTSTMSEIDADEHLWYPNSAYHRTDNSSESSESLDPATERSALLPQKPHSDQSDNKSIVHNDEESQQLPEQTGQPLLTEQPNKSVFAIIGLLLIGNKVIFERED